MSKSSSTWQRVTKRQPCAVCGKADWCLYAGPDDSPTAVICARTESSKRCGEGGWLHVLRDDGPTWAPWQRSIRVAVRMMNEPSNGKSNFAKLAADYRQAVKPEALNKLAVALGVSIESLRRLGVSWSAQHRAWSFPMQDAVGNVLGIRLRLVNGRKLSVKGGKEGLFIPSPRPNPLPEGEGTHAPLLIAGGPTDTAVFLDLGFSVVGRLSWIGGVELLVKLAREYRPAEIAIVADGDLAGQRGAETLGVVLLAYWQSVRIITPPIPFKDARAWRQGGATAADVQSLIDAAPVRKLTIAAKRKET